MKRVIFTLIIVACFSVGCSACKRESKLNMRENNIMIKDSVDTILFIPDISIDKKIFLNYPISIENLFGNIMPLMERNAEFPYVYMINNEGDQYLKMIFLPGNEANSISKFEVGWTNSLNITDKSHPSNFEYFITENKIALGISKEELLTIKGNNYTTTQEDDILLIKYIIDDFKNSEFLKKYNMPIYTAIYWIKEDKIIKYQFGFEYP